MGSGKLFKSSTISTNSVGGLASGPGPGPGDKSITIGDGTWYSGDQYELEDGTVTVGLDLYSPRLALS